MCSFWPREDQTNSRTKNDTQPSSNRNTKKIIKNTGKVLGPVLILAKRVSDKLQEEKKWYVDNIESKYNKDLKKNADKVRI